MRHGPCKAPRAAATSGSSRAPRRSRRASPRSKPSTRTGTDEGRTMTTTVQRRQITPAALNGQRAADAPALPAMRRNRTRVALGALIIVLSVLGVMTLYSRASDRVDVLSVRHEVGAGQQI